MQSRQVDLTPPNSISPFRWLWGIWAFLCTALLVVSAVILSERVSIVNEEVYKGSFVPAHTAHDIILPAGVPLSQMLVTEGDTVVSGQRLALYDQAALERRMEQLSLKLLLNDTLRDCLLNRDSFAETDLTGMDLDSEARLSLQASLRECRLMHRQSGLERSEIQIKLKSLQNRAQLAVQTLMSDQSLRQTMSKREIALRVAVEQQKYTDAIEPLEFKLATMITNQEIQLLKRVATLTQEAERDEAALAVLEQFAAQPWLVAPDNGRVQRLRGLSGQTVFAKDTVVVRLLNDEKTTFEVRAEVPATHSKSFRVDDQVWVRLSGMPINTPPVKATISDISDLSGQAAPELKSEVTILLDIEQIQDDHIRRLVQRQMETGNTRSFVSFETDQSTLFDTLFRAAQDMLPQGEAI